MSLILDALRKAERERNLGQTPTLADVTTTAPKKAARKLRPNIRVLGLAALVIGLLALTILFWPQRDAPTAPAEVALPDEEQEAAKTIAPEPLPAPVPAPTPQMPPEPAQTLDVPRPMAANTSGGPQSLDEILDTPSDEAEGNVDAAEEDLAAVAPTAEDLAAESTATKASETPVEKPADEPSAEAATETPEDAANAGSAPAEEEEPQVKRLQDQPAEYRSSFPMIKLEVHVYDPNPLKRWFMAGGRKYIEGSKLPEGPRVIEITPEGVVFNYRGETSLLTLKR